MSEKTGIKVILAASKTTSLLSPGGRALARAGLAELDRRLTLEEQHVMQKALRKSAKLVRKGRPRAPAQSTEAI